MRQDRKSREDEGEKRDATAFVESRKRRESVSVETVAIKTF